jgi:hypothetical protein
MGYILTNLQALFRPAELSLGPGLRRQALRLGRTAPAAMEGLTASSGQTKTPPCIMEMSVEVEGPAFAAADARLTEARNERSLDTGQSGATLATYILRDGSLRPQANM